MKREDALQEALSRGLMGATDRAAPGVDPKPKGMGKGDTSKRERPESAPPGGGKASAGEGTQNTHMLALPTIQALAYAEAIVGTRTFKKAVRRTKRPGKGAPPRPTCRFSYMGNLEFGKECRDSRASPGKREERRQTEG